MIYTDNDAVAKMALDAKSIKRALHIMRRIAWVQERVHEDDFKVTHLPGVYMSADMHTKVVGPADFARFVAFHNGVPSAVGE